MPQNTIKAHLADFSDVLRKKGVLQSLGFLNARVEHRCTAIYRLEALTVRNLHLFDREKTLFPEELGVVPLGDSFCQFAMRDGSFLTDDSSVDSRLDGNPYQGKVVSYHAVPLLGRNGELFGTLCHFDFVTRSLPDGEFEFLQQVARVLPNHL